jgi:hypothetical protein
LWLLLSFYTVSWKTPEQFRTLDRNGINMLKIEYLGQESEQISWTGSDYELNMQVSFGNRIIATIQSVKFLGLTVDTSLTWKCHIGELTSRLNKAC